MVIIKKIMQQELVSLLNKESVNVARDKTAKNFNFAASIISLCSIIQLWFCACKQLPKREGFL